MNSSNSMQSELVEILHQTVMLRQRMAEYQELSYVEQMEAEPDLRAEQERVLGLQNAFQKRITQKTDDIRKKNLNKYVSDNLTNTFSVLERLQVSGWTPEQVLAGLGFHRFGTTFWHTCSFPAKIMLITNPSPETIEIAEMEQKGDLIELQECDCEGFKYMTEASNWRTNPKRSIEAILLAHSAWSWCLQGVGLCPCVLGGPCPGRIVHKLLQSLHDNQPVQHFDYAGVIRHEMLDALGVPANIHNGSH